MEKALTLVLILTVLSPGTVEARDWMRQTLREGHVPEDVEREPIPRLFENDEEAAEALRRNKGAGESNEEIMLRELKEN